MCTSCGDERARKVEGILNTMYPPPELNNEIRRLRPNERLIDMLSIEVQLFGELMTEVISLAMSRRFDLSAIDGPTNPVTGVIGGLPAGPSSLDPQSWLAIMREHLITAKLIEKLDALDIDVTSKMFELMNKSKYSDKHRDHSGAFDLHAAVVDYFVATCSTVFANMFDYFNTGYISLPDGRSKTSCVWMHHKDNKNVIWLHRILISFAEMPYIAIRLCATLVFSYKVILFCDEFNDLTELQLHELLLLYKQFRALAARCNRCPTQFVFVGDGGQSIYLLVPWRPRQSCVLHHEGVRDRHDDMCHCEQVASPLGCQH